VRGDVGNSSDERPVILDKGIAFKNERLAGHITLSKGERSPLAELAANLLRGAPRASSRRVAGRGDRGGRAALAARLRAP
jgi:hypothetical protein